MSLNTSRILITALIVAVGLPVASSRAAAIDGYKIIDSQPITSTAGEVGRQMICRCVSDDDRIIVYRTTGSAPVSPLLDQPADFIDTLWLIDVGNRGFHQIAIEFSQQDDRLIAKIFQDQDGNGSIMTALRDGQTVITEPGYAAIRIESLDGYWQRNGRIAENLNIVVDDRMLATFGGELYQDAMVNDGQPDVLIRVRGPHGDDRRSYDWRNVETPFPASSGIYRTTLTVREQGEEPAFAPVFPWFLLGATYGATLDFAGGTIPTVPLAGTEGRPYGIVKHYGESFPPIQVNWVTGQIAYVGEFVASRGGEHNWFTYSIKRIEQDTVTNPNFESPFAYYDLAANNDGVPELQVRSERTVRSDPYVDSVWRGREYQQISYSWEQRDGQEWSYKVDLLGQHDIDTYVEFPEFTLQTIPYSEFPVWVTSRSWDVAAFVAVERGLYRSSEGIYEWGPSRELRDRFYAGTNDRPGEPYQEITEGLRGEYQLVLEAQPYLYFSPVDARLHLIRADRGVYNVDDITRVEYRNLNGGDTINSWHVFKGDDPIVQLVQLHDGLLYTQVGRVSLVRADIRAETFRTLPPTNHEEWTQLGQRLDEHERDFAADDLAAMFNQFEGEQFTIDGANMRDFRFTDNGYRFVVELHDGYDLGSFPITGIDGPGHYAVSYDNVTQRFSAVVATPPDISVDMPALTTTDALEARTLDFQLSNTGCEDVTTVPIVVKASGPGQPEQLVHYQTVDLLAETTLTIAEVWTPPAPGTWTLDVYIFLPGGEVVQRQATVDVRAAAAVSWIAAIRAGWPDTPGPGYLWLLAGVVGAAGAGSLILVRRAA